MERVPQLILERLAELHSLASDDLFRLLYFLSGEETDPSFLDILNRTIDNDRSFEMSVRMIMNCDDMRQLEHDESYQSFLADTGDKTLPQSSAKAGDGQRFSFDFISEFESLFAASNFHISRTTSAEQAVMMGVASRVADTSTIVDVAMQYLSSGSKCVPAVATTIICIQLSRDVYRNVRMWWKGEISGKRCIKNILDSGIGMVVGGLAGGYGGEALGALITMHPFGAIVGGVVGAIVGWGVTHAIIDRLTQKILDLPKSVALENAFRFLDLPVTASNNQVNTQYRRLALIYHPDRPGGSVDKFLSLQLCVGIIKAEREEGPAPGAPPSGVPRAPIQVTAGDDD